MLGRFPLPRDPANNDEHVTYIVSSVQVGIYNQHSNKGMDGVRGKGELRDMSLA